MTTSLADLRWHWGSAYEFSYSHGTWSAHPVDAPAETLRADSAEALLTLVRRDRLERQSRRSLKHRSRSLQ